MKKIIFVLSLLLFALPSFAQDMLIDSGSDAFASLKKYFDNGKAATVNDLPNINNYRDFECSIASEFNRKISKFAYYLAYAKVTGPGNGPLFPGETLETVMLTDINRSFPEFSYDNIKALLAFYEGYSFIHTPELQIQFRTEYSSEVTTTFRVNQGFLFIEWVTLAASKSETDYIYCYKK